MEMINNTLFKFHRIKSYRAILFFSIILTSNYIYPQIVHTSEKPFLSNKHHFKISFPCVPEINKEELNTNYSCVSFEIPGIYRVFIKKLSGTEIFNKEFNDTYINGYKNLAVKDNLLYEVLRFKGLQAIVVEADIDLGDTIMKNKTITFLKHGNSYNISFSSQPDLVSEYFNNFINSFEFLD